MLARHDDKSQIAVYQVHFYGILSSSFAFGSCLCALYGRRLAVFVGVLEDNVAVLQESADVRADTWKDGE